MKKEIRKVTIDGKEIGFTNALLYVGRNNGITYILDIENPQGYIERYVQQQDIFIVTKNGEEKTIVGSLGYINNTLARFYINGEPFPVTQGEINRFY